MLSEPIAPFEESRVVMDAAARCDPSVSVVIVTHDRPNLLERALSSLAECDLPERFSQTLVCDNGKSMSASEVVARADPRVRAKYQRIMSPLKTVALNRALELLEDDLVIFLDDDVRVSRNVLVEYVAAARREGRGTYFGGPALPDYETKPPDWLKRYLPPSAVGFCLPETAEQKSRYSFLGFNWAAFAGDLRHCGGFSSQFGPGTLVGDGDETFMQLQLNRIGIEGVYVRDALVWHLVPVERCSLKWTLRRAYGGGFNAGILAADWARAHELTLGLTRSFVRHLQQKMRRVSVIGLLGLRRSEIFWVRHTSRWLAAFVAGYQFGWKHRPLDSARWKACGIGDVLEKDKPTARETSIPTGKRLAR